LYSAYFIARHLTSSYVLKNSKNMINLWWKKNTFFLILLKKQILFLLSFSV
jgi:hypothetical protein